MIKYKICFLVWSVIITVWLKASVTHQEDNLYENEDSGFYYDDINPETDNWYDQWKEQKRWQPDDSSINIHDPYMNIVAGNSKIWTNFDHSRPSRRSDNPLPNPLLANDLGSLNMSNPLSKYHCPINLLYGNNLTVKNFFLLMPRCNMSANDTLETIKTSENQEGSEENLISIPPYNTQKEIGSISLNPESEFQTQLPVEELGMLSSYNGGNDTSNINSGITTSFITTIRSSASVGETTVSVNGNGENTESTTGNDTLISYVTKNSELSSSFTVYNGTSGPINNYSETTSSVTKVDDVSSLVTANGEASSLVTNNGETISSVTSFGGAYNLVTSNGEETSLNTGNGEATSSNLENSSNLGTSNEETTNLVTGNGERTSSVTRLKDASNLITVPTNEETTSSVTSLGDVSISVTGQGSEGFESISRKTTSVNEITTVSTATAISDQSPDRNKEILRTIDKYCETFSLSFDDRDSYTINPVSIGQQPAFQNLNMRSTFKQHLTSNSEKQKRSAFLRNPRKYFKLNMLNPFKKKTSS